MRTQDSFSLRAQVLPPLRCSLHRFLSRTQNRHRSYDGQHLRTAHFADAFFLRQLADDLFYRQALGKFFLCALWLSLVRFDENFLRRLCRFCVALFLRLVEERQMVRVIHDETDLLALLAKLHLLRLFHHLMEMVASIFSMCQLYHETIEITKKAPLPGVKIHLVKSRFLSHNSRSKLLEKFTRLNFFKAFRGIYGQAFH